MVVLLATCAGCGPSGPLYESTWELVSLNGQPPMEEVIPTLRVYGNKYGGYDGCKIYSVDSDGGPPFGPARDVSSGAGLRSTLWGCENKSIRHRPLPIVTVFSYGMGILSAAFSFRIHQRCRRQPAPHHGTGGTAAT